jgi:hypothetical protein
VSTKLFNNHIIFSIDNCFDTHTAATFLRHIDGCNALMKLKYPMVTGIGKFRGDFELCFMLDYNDFVNYAQTTYWLKNQESVLRLYPRTPHTTLNYHSMISSVKDPLDPLVLLGEFSETTKQEAEENEYYTYIFGRFYVAKG